MALRLVQVTIAAVGVQPTQVIAANTPISYAVIESDDGNSNAVFVGASGMATDGSEGIRLDNSATAPGRVTLGPFSGHSPVGLHEVFVVGTENEIVNVWHVPY